MPNGQKEVKMYISNVPVSRKMEKAVIEAQAYIHDEKMHGDTVKYSKMVEAIEIFLKTLSDEMSPPMVNCMVGEFMVRVHNAHMPQGQEPAENAQRSRAIAGVIQRFFYKKAEAWDKTQREIRISDRMANVAVA